MTTACRVCLNSVISSPSGWLNCSKCNNNIHTFCTERRTTPGGIYGDVFYNFTCSRCSETGNEIFKRKKMSWFMTIFLVMYHFHHKSSSSAKRGFFHWKQHIVSYIEKNWTVLFPRDFKRKRNWIGAISSTLSLYSPFFFNSGVKELNEMGWWCLTFPKLIPHLVSIISAKLIATKQLKSMKFEKHIDNVTDMEDIKNMLKSYVPEHFINIAESFFKTSKLTLSYNIESIPNGITQNITEIDKHVDVECVNKTVEVDDDIEIEWDLLEMPEDSLFRKAVKTSFCDFWRTNIHLSQQPKSESNKKKKLVHLRLHEEVLLAKHLAGNNSFAAQRLKRKVLVRQLKKKKRYILFDVEDKCHLNTMISKRLHHYGQGSVSDAKKDLRMISACQKATQSTIVSPFSKRWLKPYIYCWKDVIAPWPILMKELLLKHDPTVEIPNCTLDFCYVKPCHIPVVNSICERFFWSGIELADTLEYPDFSCIVLYKKLIVAFAFMVPDVKLNEAYISFIFTRPEWRRAGIAKFMLYHLIQTCQGKDITLHVSIDNPAVQLYQKFGFKVEEIIYNFYNTYITYENKLSKHAFFLRLHR